MALRTRRDGYEHWKSGHRSVLVHRLLAVAEWGFDAVADRIVHHCPGIPWDNRPSTLQFFESHREHMRFHDQVTLPESLLSDAVSHEIWGAVSQSALGWVGWVSQEPTFLRHRH